MKKPVNADANTINARSLNRGEITAEVDGIELSILINAVNRNGNTLRIANTPGYILVEAPQHQID